MELESLRLRWINYACYEIVLPNKKTIIVDPCIDFEKKVEFTNDEFKACDYIMLSHTHYDHTMEVGDLCSKYKPKVIVGELSAYRLCEFFDIDFDCMFPVSPNETFKFDDFRLDVFRGKHTLMNNENNKMSKKQEGFSSVFPAGHKYCDINGSLEYMNYLITTNENVRILIWGGPKENFYYNNIFDVCDKFAPNIVIKQLSTKYTPEEFGEAMAKTKAQLILPLHQDGVARKGKITVEEYVSRANNYLAEHGYNSKVVNPKQYEWLNISTNIKY